MAGHMPISTVPFSHHHLPQRCFWPDLVQTSPIDHLVFYFPVLALFPTVFCFLFVLPIFLFWFFLYCYFSAYFVCVLFLQFCQSSPRQFRCPSPTAGLYSVPPPPPTTNFKRTCQWLVCLNAIGFSMYFLFACIWFFPIFLLCFCL
jgi:hypothetical protein